MTVAAAVLAAALAALGPPAAPVARDTVLVARHDLARGVAITADDVAAVVDSTDARPAAADAPRPAIGWLTRRVIRAGEPLRPPAVEPPPLIARGAAVTVVWETAGLRVTREGTAVGAAHRGERVVVRVDGARRLTGIATDAGTVTVRP